ncbi:MAG: reverse transcriptase domain-containing protein [Gammaproteobacteria bacterium]|nr:reverse transcriptase domain-containing protein [Gammaproteobacteria bacterium]
MNSSGRRPLCLPILTDKNKNILILALLLSGDIELNPGPRKQPSTYPCGLCELPVTWDCRGACCDACNIWHHKSCIELCTQDYELLDRSNVQWLCCRCDSINVSTFTFRSYEIDQSNIYEPLSGLDLTMESNISSFSPLKASSPKSNVNNSNHTRTTSNSSSSNISKNPYDIPTKRNLRIMTVNCRSIKDKRQEFETALHYLKPDIVCATESWLKGIKPGKNPTKDAILSSEIFPPQYNVYRNDRGTIGGGVFILVHKSITSMEQPTYITDGEIEWVNIKIKNNKDLLVGSYYMPHREQRHLEELNKSLNKIDQHNKKNIILTGDFNCPNIRWDLSTANGPDREIQQELIDIMGSNNLTQIHNSPTREGNLLDLVFVSNPTVVKSSINVPGISDHDIIITDLETKVQHQKTTPRKRYIYNKANWKCIENDLNNLQNIVNDKDQQGADVQELWDTFKKNLFESMDKNIPNKEIKSRNTIPWIKKRERKMLKKKQRLYKQARKTNKWTNYRSFQKECKRQLRKSEWEYVNNNIIEGLNNNNTKPFWKYVKSKRQDSGGIAPLKKGTNLISDSKEKAELLLSQFKSVFTKETNSEMPLVRKQAKVDITPIIIDQKGLEKLLSRINPFKSSGPDNIPNRILKECATHLAPILKTILQRSLDTGQLPKDWRDANISSIFKKGDKHLPENYRPVSLTSVTCKILEHIICRHIMKHLERNKILTNLNHGFRSGYSCETQLITTINDFLKEHDKGHQVDIAILDFSKAFDTVPHNKLLHKLNNYGIKGNIHKWLTNFLTTRTMRTIVEGEHSKETSVDSGVPQGTVLGPIMFLCHINDLPDGIKSSIRLFADDCLLYRTIKTEEDHRILQADLKELERWANKWGMRFNAKKCYILSINNKSSRLYTLEDHILQEVQDNPYLGLQISNDLKWNIHVNNICKKANATLGFLRRNLRNVPESCCKTAYVSLVKSMMEYGATIWNPYLKGDIDKLERIQNRGVRFVKRDYKSREPGSISKMKKELDLETLEERRHSLRLILMYKVVEGLVPALPTSQFVNFTRPKRKIKTRTYSDHITSNILEKRVCHNTKGLSIPDSRTPQYQNSFFVGTIIHWNHLPDSVVHASSVEAFKTALGNHRQ